MTDHKAEAERLIELSPDIDHADPGAAATAHAVLYLAEQQRIANLIALVQDGEMIDPIKGHWEEGFWEDARKVIVEGLGIA